MYRSASGSKICCSNPMCSKRTAAKRRSAWPRRVPMRWWPSARWTTRSISRGERDGKFGTLLAIDRARRTLGYDPQYYWRRF
jgi:hypothetical protein